MSINIETNQLTKMYVGDTEIIKAYLGDQQVYSNAPSSRKKITGKEEKRERSSK